MKISSWCGLVGAMALAGGAVENWPQFRGPEGQGHTDAAQLPLTWSKTQNVTWRTELPGKGFSSPVIWGDQLWMTAALEEGLSFHALCVDKNSGKLLHDVEIFRREKALAIQTKNSHASPSPVIEAGRVWVNFGTTGTACLDTGTGRILWRSQELQLDHLVGPGSSPVLYQNLLILTCDGADVQYMAALDKLTGKLVWKTPRSGQLRANPDVKKSFCTPLVAAVADRDQLISPGADWVYGYEPLTGQEIWRVGYTGFSVVPRPVVGHGLAFICTGFAKPELLAIRLGAKGTATATHIAWRDARHIPLKPSLVLVNDELYAIGDTGFLTCFDVRTGQRRWEEKLAGNFSASPLAAPGRLYVFSEEGRMTVFAPGRECRKLGECELGERVMASGAVSGAALFLRTDQALYRIEERR
jgi:outer membrane protein assembly factor BamB